MARAVTAMYAVSLLLYRAAVFLTLMTVHILGALIEPWIGAAVVAVYHRLDIFEHVEPEPGNAGVLLRDGWRRRRVFAAVIEDAR